VLVTVVLRDGLSDQLILVLVGCQQMKYHAVCVESLKKLLGSYANHKTLVLQEP
jgi:hypothetical protein